MNNLLDLVGPFHGECGFCGHPDARHRVADSIASQVRAGEKAAVVAEDYDVSVENVEKLAREYFE